MRFDRHGPDGPFRGRRFSPRALAMMMRMNAAGFGAGFADDDAPGGGFRGGPFGGWPFGGGPFGRGRRGRMFGQGELRLLLLHLLGEGERHGYELIKAIGELTGGHYAPSPGVVYPTLSLLLDEDAIAEAGGEGSRKAFTLTEAGRAELDHRADEAAAIVDRLKALAEARGREASPPVMRAMTNLKMALRQRAMAGLETDISHQIADILDEAARRIERL
ncbi:helix-turn-helix transcriptional regulator [Novosphingobium flavum]|uniref:Helix-turn-helix transcriptional regulator n=1 Tax=Novosphingobium aerophilum TaxID=2839843 RepID=A0A7X1KBH9_9SPHN|nr:PadR family transcriptional regulator [Novosphingobium aerophilum]MBC2651082.1 helix-turn-helix transcriptional regulator [Novosphingobium aerophilum]MBC2662948.1 helix-turn-helix transcriptional regulator [Novosphingobium aerophilum]